MGWQPSSPYVGENISTHRLEIFGNSQRGQWMANAKSLKLRCASQTAPPSFPPTSPTRLVPRFMTNFCLSQQGHCTSSVWSDLSASRSAFRRIFQAQVQLQGPIFQTPFSAKLRSLNPPMERSCFHSHLCLSLRLIPFELWRVLCVLNSLGLPFFENRNLPHHSCVCLHLGPPHTHFYIVLIVL